MAHPKDLSNGHLHCRQKKNNLLKHRIHKKNGVVKETKVSVTLQDRLPNLPACDFFFPPAIILMETFEMYGLFLFPGVKSFSTPRDVVV